MQIKNNYQLEWEIRGNYGIPVEKGVGVFNGDTGIIREINSFAEMMTVEFDEKRFVEYSFKQLMNWNWLMRSLSIKPREVSIRQ